MAAFEYPFNSNGTPVSFPIPGTAVTGIDEAGTLTVTTLRLADNITVVIDAVKTQAQIAEAMLTYLNARNYGRSSGIVVAAGDAQLAAVTTVVAAAD